GDVVWNPGADTGVHAGRRRALPDLQWRGRLARYADGDRFLVRDRAAARVWPLLWLAAGGRTSDRDPDASTGRPGLRRGAAAAVGQFLHGAGRPTGQCSDLPRTDRGDDGSCQNLAGAPLEPV